MSFTGLCLRPAPEKHVKFFFTPNKLGHATRVQSFEAAFRTRKLLGNLFEFENLGAKDLKGIAGPLRTWAALRPSLAEGRFEALHPGGAPPALVEGKGR